MDVITRSWQVAQAGVTYELRSFYGRDLGPKSCKNIFGILVQLYQISTFIGTDFGTQIPEIN